MEDSMKVPTPHLLEAKVSSQARTVTERRRRSCKSVSMSPVTTNQFYFTAACSLGVVIIPLAMVYFKRLRQPSSSSSVVQDKTIKNYWYDRVHPELIALPIMYTINSWWMVWIFHALSSIPGKTDADIIMTKVDGIGSYYAAKSNETNENKQQPTTRAILWIHGGGRILGAANGMSEPCQQIVKLFGGSIPVLSVEYRFPPKYPFPAALHDCHKAYSWLVDKVQFEGRIAVAGMSAGAGLAAELCQLILDEDRLPLPVFIIF